MSARTERLLLYAPNIHTGGGAVLLQSLLESWCVDWALIAWLDARIQGSIRLPPNTQVVWVKPSFRSRLNAEFSLSSKASLNDRILCFHGLPPLLPQKGKLIIFLQNRNYLGLVPLDSFAWRTRQRLRFEQTVARLFRHRCESYWVQTPSMARELRKWYGKAPISIRVLSFSPFTEPVPFCKPPKWDFVYVADGEAHKNHRCLIEAWISLSQEGLRPSLVLTLSARDSSLLAWVNKQQSEYDLHISNLGHLSHKNLLLLYGRAQALIFPSISESFGLPLIEARQLGLPILAGELDFVRDVCEPVQCFDPSSPQSIARAVKRFLGKRELPVELVGSEAFLSAVMRE